jgi:hypothetical protein
MVLVGEARVGDAIWPVPDPRPSVASRASRASTRAPSRTRVRGTTGRHGGKGLTVWVEVA